MIDGLISNFFMQTSGASAQVYLKPPTYGAALSETLNPHEVIRASEAKAGMTTIK